ncbi:MAG: chorismate mutase [Alphaproteobacteria bacterium]|nr:chorismate mutase [Alphaproteobacteria bacterium]
MSLDITTLAALRDEIDAIDREIHALIERRAAIAPKVIAAKGGAPIWRPAREAQVLRTRLAAAQGGLFSPLCLLGIWTQLMTGMTSIEVDFCFGIIRSTVEKITPTIRNHFGALPRLVPYDSANAVLGQTAHAITILPWPEPNLDDKWWPLLTQEEFKACKIGFALPFLPSHESQAPVALVAKILLEESGDDFSLLILPRGRLADWHRSAARFQIIDQTAELALIQLHDHPKDHESLILETQAETVGLVPRRIE